ncbi:hypothetical protein [Rhodococcus sp. T2V]|uniref:hypothetical protein n=1 Tax=Rhodococcus sp. T2V TaxID=3034164 RepID=UPI0023E22323|nr:hypothetical protein [Rhodococcus sp. T2V]
MQFTYLQVSAMAHPVLRPFASSMWQKAMEPTCHIVEAPLVSDTLVPQIEMAVDGTGRIEKAEVACIRQIRPESCVPVPVADRSAYGERCRRPPWIHPEEGR